MGRKGSARGPSEGRCFLAGPFCSGARVDASLRSEASSPSLMHMHIGLPALQLRFLATPCSAGARAAALAAGWRVLAKPSSILAAKAVGLSKQGAAAKNLQPGRPGARPAPEPAPTMPLGAKSSLHVGYGSRGLG